MIPPVQVHITGPQGSGKTRLARFLIAALSAEYHSPGMKGPPPPPVVVIFDGELVSEVTAQQPGAVTQRYEHASDPRVAAKRLAPVASGEDLDLLGELYDVERRPGEADRFYRNRVIAAITGKESPLSGHPRASNYWGRAPIWRKVGLGGYWGA